jgi:carboxyl-terminal processing protease
MSLKTKIEGATHVKVKSNFGGLVKGVTIGIVALLIFDLGVNIGNGRISFGPQASQTGLPSQLDYSTVNEVYDQLKANYNGKLTATQLTDGLKHGLAEATKDPYTEYFTAAEAKAFNGQLNNSFSGIGAELGQDSDKNLIVISPLDGFPADKAGLKAQDIITTIDGTTTTGMSVDTAVTKIRGKSGSVVTLGVVRNKTDSLTIKITRQDIQAPSVSTKTLDGNIGYMHIVTFADDTAALAAKDATAFKKQNVKGIILDLRSDPGGLLDAAIDVSSLWLPSNSTIVTEKGTGGDTTHTATGDNTLQGIPTVVLIDGGSASASEITAGALHDNKVATLIGEKSYGKGVVQQLINLNDGGQLKVTVASWYRPNGANINHKGITPDQTVKENDNATPDNDAQLIAAEAYLNK